MAASFARSFDLPVVILRPFNTYGPRQSERAVLPTIIRQALDPACTAIQLGDLSPRRDFNYVANIVEAFLAAAATPGRCCHGRRAMLNARPPAAGRRHTGERAGGWASGGTPPRIASPSADSGAPTIRGR